MSNYRPAWSWGGDQPAIIRASPLLESITWDTAFGESTGRGIRVAIIDSGVDNDHPAVEGAVRGWVEPVIDDNDAVTYNLEPHTDLFGHGTACAGIIRRMAPEAELYSVRVLGARLSGKGAVFAAGLQWAIEHDMHVVNLSLGTTKQESFARFHELVDAAYFRNTVLVTAANNMPITSFPSLFATVISVASYDGMTGDDPTEYYCNPAPPVEFGTHGIDVQLAWLDGGYITATGNSFAAPHLTGIVTALRSKHPMLTPFQIKTVLRALARNVRS